MLSAVYEVAADNRVAVGAGGHVDFNGGVGGCKFGKSLLEEDASWR